MKVWTVIQGNQPLGIVEGLGGSEVEAARQKFNLGPHTMFKLERDLLAMHILIDTTNNRAIARHDSYKALAALATVQFANVDTVIIRMGQNKSFAVLDASQLDSVAQSVGVTLDAGAAYGSKIKTLRAALETFPHLELPFTTEQLELQAFAIHYNDDKPYAFDPEGREPKPLAKWHFDPQVNRRRIDSSYGHCFSAGLGYGSGKLPPASRSNADADSAPPAQPAKRRAKPGTPTPPPKPAKASNKPPRAPKAPSAPATRPKPGTATGKVWDIADAAFEAAGEVTDWKAFRAAVTELAKAEGINPGTVGVQFGKWKSSKGL